MVCVNVCVCSCVFMLAVSTRSIILSYPTLLLLHHFVKIGNAIQFDCQPNGWFREQKREMQSSPVARYWKMVSHCRLYLSVCVVWSAEWALNRNEDEWWWWWFGTRGDEPDSEGWCVYRDTRATHWKWRNTTPPKTTTTTTNENKIKEKKFQYILYSNLGILWVNAVAIGEWRHNHREKGWPNDDSKYCWICFGRIIGTQQ